jgi:hypothetical protein
VALHLFGRRISKTKNLHQARSNVYSRAVSQLRRFFFFCEAIGTAATPDLLCQPRVTVEMIMKNQMECRLAKETEVLGENLPQRHFCPSQNPKWPDPGSNPGRRGGKPATNHQSYGAQAVTHRLSTAAARLRVQVRSCGICDGQSGRGQVFSEYIGFSCQFSFHRLLHIHHLSCEAGTTGQLMADVPSGLSLIPPQEVGEKVYSTETLVDFQQTTQRYIPQDRALHSAEYIYKLPHLHIWIFRKRPVNSGGLIAKLLRYYTQYSVLA